MDTTHWLESFGWVLALIALWVGALIVHSIVVFVGGKLGGKLKGGRSPHRAILTVLPKSLTRPLIILIWVLTVIFSIEILFRQWLGMDHPMPLIKMRKFAVLGFLAWWLLRWNRFAHTSLKGHIDNGEVGLELVQLDIASKLVTLFVIFLGLLLALQVAGVDIRAIVTLSGFGALALGFAGKDVFSNLFSGLMLYITRPFVVNDTINIAEKNVEGVVEKIGWYLTRIKNLDKRPQYLPNSLFSTVIITNQTRMTNRRVEFKFGLRYEDLSIMNDVIVALRSYLKSNAQIDQSIQPQVWFVEFGSFSLDVFVRAYTLSVDWADFLSVQQEILVHCAEIVKHKGADFPLPITAIQVPPLQVSLTKTLPL